ncbi:MAG TPA: hypothetical protein VHB49_05950 [Bradyrhizobium sp.]|nr:hypothetical protein [Bradyrhizobium sp.]
MDILWHVIYFLATSKFLTLFIAFLALPVVIGLSVWKGRLAKYYAVIPVLAFLNLFFGTDVAAYAMHSFGEKGSATITGSYDTSTVYNNHNVVGYHVLLKTADGKVVETSFEDDDFNIYPPKNSVVYPGIGDHFTVYYLRWFPKDFVIVDNDDSPWATGLRCGRLRNDVQEANAKYEFDRGNAGYRSDYIALINKLLSEKCVDDNDEVDAFRHDIENIEAGQP